MSLSSFHLLSFIPLINSFQFHFFFLICFSLFLKRFCFIHLRIHFPFSQVFQSLVPEYFPSHVSLPGTSLVRSMLIVYLTCSIFSLILHQIQFDDSLSLVNHFIPFFFPTCFRFFFSPLTLSVFPLLHAPTTPDNNSDSLSSPFISTLSFFPLPASPSHFPPLLE